jgi:hypothetical protein
MTDTRYNPEDGLVQDFAAFMATGLEQMTEEDVVQELEDEWVSRIAEGDFPDVPMQFAPPEQYAELVGDYYGNLMDDLHDSAGDREYQAAHLERMAIVEGWNVPGVATYTLADKAPEIRWFFGEGEVR